MEFIEGMEKLLLRSFFGGDEMNIINQEHIHGAVAALKLFRTAVFNRGNKFIREFFAGGVEHGRGRALLKDFVTDRLHEMGFPSPHAAVDEERIVDCPRPVNDRPRRGVRQLIVFPHHERREYVSRIQSVFVNGMRRGSRGMWRVEYLVYRR